MAIYGFYTSNRSRGLRYLLHRWVLRRLGLCMMKARELQKSFDAGFKAPGNVTYLDPSEKTALQALFESFRPSFYILLGSR